MGEQKAGQAREGQAALDKQREDLDKLEKDRIALAEEDRQRLEAEKAQHAAAAQAHQEERDAEHIRNMEELKGHHDELEQRRQSIVREKEEAELARLMEEEHRRLKEHDMHCQMERMEAQEHALHNDHRSIFEAKMQLARVQAGLVNIIAPTEKGQQVHMGGDSDEECEGGDAGDDWWVDDAEPSKKEEKEEKEDG